MKRPRTPTPVTSFGPELLAALIRGSTGRFEIRLPYRRAIKFRQRIHQLRTAMRMTDPPHELHSTVARTRVQILWGKDAGDPPIPIHRTQQGVPYPNDPDTMCLVVIAPHDSEFADALEKAGIKPALTESSPETVGEDLDTILDAHVAPKEAP